MVKHTKTIRRLLASNCLIVFDHFMGLANKGLNERVIIPLQNISPIQDLFTWWYNLFTYLLNMKRLKMR